MLLKCFSPLILHCLSLEVHFDGPPSPEKKSTLFSHQTRTNPLSESVHFESKSKEEFANARRERKISLGDAERGLKYLFDERYIMIRSKREGM